MLESVGRDHRRIALLSGTPSHKHAVKARNKNFKYLFKITHRIIFLRNQRRWSEDSSKVIKTAKISFAFFWRGGPLLLLAMHTPLLQLKWNINLDNPKMKRCSKPKKKLL